MTRDAVGRGRSRSSWAVVAGSAGRVGREIALRLAEDGYSVVVCGRDGAGVRETRQLIEWAGGRAAEVVADLGDCTAVHRLIDDITRLLAGSPVEVLVNNAGEADYGSVEDEFDMAFDLNVKTPFLLTEAFAPAMAARGRGAIVDVGGLDTAMRPGDRTAMRAATAALNALTRLWTAEYGPKGVRVNAVDPHCGNQPGAVAEAIRFLVSPRAASVQGAVLTMGEQTGMVESHKYSSAPV
ncbi:SDR family oxidoreductase [Nocardia sp. NPDC046473]|uniref:SDR family NAD(P)-dependent oxidoreductase n=1 Tax=Nocardia sp. NPDC046473 TaxID=3155733 RepID=UPI0033DD9940